AARRTVPGAETVGGEKAGPPAALPGGGVSLVPGAEGDENLSKAALKNKKKREAKKAKDAEAKRSPGGLAAPKENGESANGTPERRERPRSRSKAGY
ncbi:hypothetical protein LTR53_020413, partial [Teratosphaeriaceae sp. CCFEE 6253]